MASWRRQRRDLPIGFDGQQWLLFICKKMHLKNTFVVKDVFTCGNDTMHSVAESSVVAGMKIEWLKKIRKKDNYLVNGVHI